MPSMPSTTRSACSTISGGPSSERTPTRDGVRPARPRRQLGERGERVQVGHVVAGVERGPHRRPLAAARARRGPCPIGDRRPDLEHLAAPVRPQPLRLRLARRAARTRACARVLVRRAAPVEGHDRALVLDPHAQRAQLRRVALRDESLHLAARSARSPAATRGSAAPARAARRRASPRTRCRPRRRAAGRRPPSAPRCTPRRRSAATAAPAAATSPSAPCASCGALDDRRERAVHVEEQRRPRGVGREWA